MINELSNRDIYPEKLIVLHAKEQLIRHESFIKSFSKKQTQTVFKTFDCGWQRDQAFEQTKAIIEADQLKNFQGLFAANDEMAIGALEAIQTFCNDQSLKENFVIIGYDGSPTAMNLLKLKSLLLKNLVIQNGYNLGVKAVSLLERTIKDRNKEIREIPVKPESIPPNLYKQYFS